MPRKKGHDGKEVRRREMEEETRFTLRRIQQDLDLLELILTQARRRSSGLNDLIDNGLELTDELKARAQALSKKSTFDK